MANAILDNVLTGGGFTKDELPTAMGIAWAENRTLNAEAINRSAPCGSNGARAVGLMQVCTVHCGNFGLPTDRAACEKALKDADTNAKVSKQIKDAQGWTAWETFKNGSWSKYKGRNGMVSNYYKNRGIKEVADATVPDIVSEPVQILSGFVKGITDADTWFRLGKGTLGGVLIVLGTGALVFVVANKIGVSPPPAKIAKKAVKAVT